MKTLLLCALASLVSGCALASKGDPLSVRLYDPEQVKPKLTAATSAAATADAPALELGRVTSGFHLREKILHRDATHELGAYDERRWTERPENYVRRELARTLFEEGGFRRVLVGTAPTLDVEVVTFEELRLANNHGARIQLRIVLHDGRDVLLEETVGVDKTADESFDGFVVAMAQALDEVAAEVKKRVEERMKHVSSSSR